MKADRWRRVGAALLVTGGLLEAGALAVASLTSALTTTLLGAAVSAAYVAGWVLLGLGLIATGFSLVGRGRTSVKIAGVFAVVAGVVEAVQFAYGTPFGPAPAFDTLFAYLVAVVVAGLRLLSDRTLRSALRWSIAVPAACLLFSVSGDYVPLLVPVLSLPGMIALPWVGAAAAGLLLLRSMRQPISVAAHPVQG